MIRLPFRFFIIGLLLSSGLQAQLLQLPRIDSLRLSTLEFVRTLQTFLWNGNLRYGGEMGGVTMDFRQTARSRLIRGSTDAFQDELGSNLRVGGMLGERWGLTGLATSASLSDNQQLGLGNLSRHRILSGPEYYLAENVSLGLMGGYEWDKQEQAQDRGLSYLGRLRIQDLPMEEFLVDLQAGMDRSSLDPRTLQADTVSVLVVRQFSGASSNRLSAVLTNQKREFYVTADADIQKDFRVNHNVFQRKASEIGIVDTLEVSLPASMLSLSGGILSRTIDRAYRYKSFSNPASTILDTRIRETRLFGSVAIMADLASWIQSRATLGYDEREERHNVEDSPLVPAQTFNRQDLAARRLANLARRTTATLDLLSKIAEKDSLNFTGSASILRYDTPDSLNTDDRDELLLVAGIGEMHRFNRSLALSLFADVTLSHLVYLNRLQSANNNWNRILRFRSTVEYLPNRAFNTILSSEVLANYTVYDFEEQVLAVKSYSFRQASWSDSTVWLIGKRLTATILGTVRLYERGVLKWKEFRERPENYFVEQSYWPQIALQMKRGINVAVGYRYFSQARYRYEGHAKKLERTIENSGPTVSLTWRGQKGSVVALEGWREAQHVDGIRKRIYSNMSFIVGMTL